MTEEIMNIEVTQELYDQMKELADEANMSVDDFVSKIVNDAFQDGTFVKVITNELEQNKTNI